MKKLVFFALVIGLVSTSAFAIGPIPVNLRLGAAGGSLGGGLNAGIDIGLALPGIPNFFIEADSTGLILPLVFVNAATETDRLGIGTRFSLAGDTLQLALSAGSATISTNTEFIWGGDEIKKTQVTSYLSIGPELRFLGIGAYLKATFMPLPQATAGEVDFGLLASF